jgi:hypothetical protein
LYNMAKHLPHSLLIFAIITSIYLLTMPIIVQHSGDAVSEVERAKKGIQSLRPNHLILTPTYHLYLLFLRKIGVGGQEFIQLQVLNVMAGALCCSLFFIFLVNHGCTLIISLFGSFVTAFSFAPWLHSREVESSILSQLFMILSAFFLSFLKEDFKRSTSYILALLASVSIALAILYSMNYVLLFPAFCLLLFLYAPKGYRLKLLILFSFISFLITFITYLLALQVTVGKLDLKSLISWVTYHPSGEHLSESKDITLTNLLRSFSGIINYFIGYTPIPTNLKLLLREEKTFAIPIISWIKFIFGLFFTAYLFFHSIWIRLKKEVFGMILLLTSFIPVLFFNTFWLGSDPQFWIPAIPFAILQACIIMSNRMDLSFYKKLVKPSLILIPLLLFIINCTYPVPITLMPEGSKNWKMAKNFSQILQKKDLVIYLRGWPSYLKYTNKIDLTDHHSLKGKKKEDYLDTLCNEIDAALNEGAQVYAIEIFALDDPSGIFYTIGGWDEVQNLSGLKRHEIINRLNNRYRNSIFNKELFGKNIWKITPKSGGTR